VKEELECIWTALGQLLSVQIDKISTEIYSQDQFQLEVIDLINFCLEELPIQEKMTQLNMGKRFQELLIPIISRLLSGVEQISDANLEDCFPALMLIENILERLANEEN